MPSTAIQRTGPRVGTAPVTAAAGHYGRHRPGWATRHLLNPTLDRMMRCGLSFRGSRVLRHQGRQSGRFFSTPINLLTADGVDYLVAPRGETQWVRNVRAAGGHLELLLGRRREARLATEVPVGERPPILRLYLRRWQSEVGSFFDGVGADAPEVDLVAVAARHPVFRLSAPLGGR